MKIASVAAAALIAALTFSGTAFAKDVAPHTSHAAKASPHVTETKRPVKKPILDLTPTQSIVKSDGKPADARSKVPAEQNGIMVNPWIVPSTF